MFGSVGHAATGCYSTGQAATGCCSVRHLLQAAVVLGRLLLCWVR